MLKALRSDNGGEYISRAFSSYMNDHGIQQQLTVPYSPQQNGVAERMNRTLMNHTRSMLLSKNLGKEFWAEALSTAVYVRNRVTSSSLPPNTTPHHLWFGEAPNIYHLRVFGAKCWYVVPKVKVRKLDARSHESMMFGYAPNSKGYKLWDAHLRKIIISRDVTFADEIAMPSSENTKVKEISKSKLDLSENNSDNNIDTDNEISQIDDVGSDTDPDENEDYVQAAQEETQNESQVGFSEPVVPPVVQPRRGTRIRKQTQRMYVPDSWANFAKFAAQQNTPEFSLVTNDSSVPKTFKQATSAGFASIWTSAIDSEHDSLIRNLTWKLDKRTAHMNVLPSKYVFRMKTSGPKARVVAVGFLQVHGVDFVETYAPVVNIITVRMLLGLTATMDLELHQMDVVTAFLYGDLDEVPEGLRDPKRPDLVRKLLKSLYGLKQAPRQRYAKIHAFLVNELGFISSQNDSCLNTLHKSSEIVIIVLYVDDLLIAGSKLESIDRIKKEFKKRF